MKCSLNVALSENDISAVIDGQADDAMREHVAQCPACRARVESARVLETALKVQMHRFDCPSSQELADYHLGFVAATDPVRDRAIILHLETCASCTAEIEVLRAFLADAPVAATTPAEQPQRQSPRFGDVFARLLPRTPQMALRGAASATISAEIDDITLLFDPQPSPQGGLTLHGQILMLDADQFNGADVAALSGETVVAQALVDDLGSFELGPLATGHVDVRLVPADGPTIWVKDIELS